MTRHILMHFCSYFVVFSVCAKNANVNAAKYYEEISFCHSSTHHCRSNTSWSFCYQLGERYFALRSTTACEENYVCDSTNVFPCVPVKTKPSESTKNIETDPVTEDTISPTTFGNIPTTENMSTTNEDHIRDTSCEVTTNLDATTEMAPTTESEETTTITATEEAIDTTIPTEELTTTEEPINTAEPSSTIEEILDNQPTTEDILDTQTTEQYSTTEGIVKSEETEEILDDTQSTEISSTTEDILDTQTTEQHSIDTTIPSEELTTTEEPINTAEPSSTIEEILDNQSTEISSTTEDILNTQTTKQYSTTEGIVKSETTEPSSTVDEILVQENTKNDIVTTTTQITPTTTRTSTTRKPKQMVAPTCTDVGFFDGPDCTQYWQCERRLWWFKPKLNSCPFGQHFSLANKKCLPIAEANCQ